MFLRKKTNLEGVRLCHGIPMTTNLSNPKMSHLISPLPTPQNNKEITSTVELKHCSSIFFPIVSYSISKSRIWSSNGITIPTHHILLYNKYVFLFLRVPGGNSSQLQVAAAAKKSNI